MVALAEYSDTQFSRNYFSPRTCPYYRIVFKGVCDVLDWWSCCISQYIWIAPLRRKYILCVRAFLLNSISLDYSFKSCTILHRSQRQGRLRFSFMNLDFSRIFLYTSTSTSRFRSGVSSLMSLCPIYSSSYSCLLYTYSQYLLTFRHREFCRFILLIINLE